MRSKRCRFHSGSTVGFQPCLASSWKATVASLDFCFAASHFLRWACIRVNGPRPHQVQIQGSSILSRRARSTEGIAGDHGCRAKHPNPETDANFKAYDSKCYEDRKEILSTLRGAVIIFVNHKTKMCQNSSIIFLMIPTFTLLEIDCTIVIVLTLTSLTFTLIGLKLLSYPCLPCVRNLILSTFFFHVISLLLVFVWRSCSF